MANNRISFISLMFYVVIGVTLLAAFIFVLPVYRNHKKIENQVERLEKDLATTKAECLRLNRLVHDLRHNPEATEKIAREKFNLCEPGEVIYQYEKDKGKVKPKTDSNLK